MREDWQIEQGKRCSCGGSDEWCGCQNNKPSTKPRKMPNEIIAWPSSVTPGGETALTGSWSARRHYTDEAVVYVPKAELQAAVAAEREACAEICEANIDGITHHGPEPHLLDSAHIRARGNTDALERVRQEAKAEALRDVLEKAKVHRDKNWYPSLEGFVLDLIPDEHKEDG